LIFLSREAFEKAKKMEALPIFTEQVSAQMAKSQLRSSINIRTVKG
jgi:hypothetical protein